MGFRGYKRSIILEFDYQEITKGIPQIKQQMALLNAEYRKSQAEVERTGSSFDKLGIKQDYLKNKQQLQAKQVEELRKKVEALKTSEEANSKTLNNAVIALRNAETQLAKTEQELEDVNKEVEEQKTTLGQLSTQWNDFKGKLSEAGINVDQVAGTMQRAGAAMAAVGTASAAMSMSFGTLMSKARTIADESQMSYEDMKSGVMDLANQYGIAANDMADAFYNVLTSNVQTKDSMVMLERAARLSKAGFMDVSTAIDVLTTLMNGYGLSIEETDAYVDQLIKTQKLGKLNVGEFGDSIGRVVSIAAQFGVEIPEIEAAIATLTLSGVDANEAITGIRRVLVAVVDPSEEAKKCAKELGLQFNASALKSKGFTKFLQDVQNKTHGNSEALTQLFGNISGLSAILNLAGTGSEDFARCLNEIINSAGTADESLKLLNEDVGTKFNASLTRLKNSLTEAGDAFSPVIVMIANFLGILAKLPSGVIVAITALGSFLMMIGTLIKLISSLSATFGTIKKAGELFSSTVGNSVYRTFVKWAAIIIGVVVAITGLVIAINALTGKSADMDRSFSNVLSSVSGMMTNTQGSMANIAARSYAIGTQYHKGGPAYVGEYGPEEVWLPEGSRVVTARDTRKNNNKTEKNSNVESLLREMIGRLDKIETSINEQPKRQQQLLRMGTV